MAGFRTLTSDISLDALSLALRFTHARLKSDPNAAPYVADFVAFAAQLAKVKITETDLEGAVADAEAGVVAADAALDGFVDRVMFAIHGPKKPNLADPLHVAYAGSMTPSRFKRPVLGTELASVQSWTSLLAKASQPALLALAPDGFKITV